MVQIRYGLVSITGNYRDNNEDSGTADSHGRFFVVADGMGGQAAGEKASQLATEIFPEVIEQKIDFDSDPPDKVRKVLDDAVAQANGEIIALGEVEPQYHQMGTTIVFLVHAAGRFYIGGVGDSRCYRLRGGKMERLTTDHSLTEALKDAGTITEDEAKTHRYKNVLYRYLGTKEGGAGTDPKDFEPQSGDRYILCTDGVTDGMEEPR
jgi:serine/threonine protein phosphatase PrpC